MKKIRKRGVGYRASRVAYISNYFLVILILFLINQAMPNFDFNVRWHSAIFVILVLVAVFLVQEPEIERITRHYRVTNTEIIMVEGILSKRRIVIPYQSISDINVLKSVIGRIFNYGNIIVTSFKNQIKIRNIRNPDELYRIIEHKVSRRRGRGRVVEKQ